MAPNVSNFYEDGRLFALLKPTCGSEAPEILHGILFMILLIFVTLQVTFVMILLLLVT